MKQPELDLFDPPALGAPEWIGKQTVLLPGFALGYVEALLPALRSILRAAPFRNHVTPGGRNIEVASTNCGALGWISDLYEKDDDIRACGGDAEAVRHGQPGLPIELMVAFLYDQIQRGNPMGFFGMVQVLEGTSVAIALTVADQLKSGLGLPPQAMSYLSSHGALDQEHLKFFESLMNRVEDAADQAAIIHSAKVVYRLYSDMLYQLMETQAS